MLKLPHRLPGLPGSYPIDAELENHKTPDNGWLAVEGKVYDVSGYSHPGGAALLTANLGRHLSQDEFDSVHGRGGRKALEGLPCLGQTSFAPPLHDLHHAAPGAPNSSTLTVYSTKHSKVLTVEGKEPAEAARKEHEALRKFFLGRTFSCKFAQVGTMRGAGVVGHYPAPLGSPENGPLLSRDLGFTSTITTSSSPRATTWSTSPRSSPWSRR